MTVTLPPKSDNRELTLDEIDSLHGNRIAIIGPSGGGKTWLAATWPDPAFADTDSNIGTLKQKSWRAYAGVPEGKRIVVARFADEVDKRGVLVKAKGFWELLEKLNEWDERPDIKTIVIDTLTSTSSLAMNVGITVAGLDKRSQTLKEAQTKYFVNLYTQADFGAEMSVMAQLLDQLPMISKTVIVNCHMRIERNDKGALLGYTPLITGDKHRSQFGKWFNEVWWLETRGSGPNAKRVLMTRSDNLHPFVKTTMGLPPEIENPTYAKIMSLAK